MNSCDRRIRRVCFACQREEHARRGRMLLEDALRTASLGDEGRVVVIRSLALGRLSPHSSPMEWSLRLEQQVRRVKAAAVFAETPGAAAAEAVWFHNEIAMWVALATRAARGMPCCEWFWTLAALGWSPQLGVRETLRLAFRRLVAAGGWPATFALARRLAREGGLLPLLRALSADDVRLVLPDVADSSSAPSDEPPAGGESIRTENALVCPRDWRTVVAQFFDESHAGDARLVWLMAAALFSETAVPPSVSEAQRLACQAVRRLSLLRARGEEAATIEISRPPETARTVSSQPETEESSSKPAEPQHHAKGEITACGGLFFLVPLFARLGTAEFPGAGAAVWEALRLVLERCQRSCADELSRLLPKAMQSTPTMFVLGPLLGSSRRPLCLSRWRGDWHVLLDATERLPLAAWPRGMPPPTSEIAAERVVRRAAEFPFDLNPLTLGLALGAHRLCRRQTGLGLKTLVRRPARIAMADTHIDLFFRPGEADIRIRRAALDVDPGWIPWLGRIVSFHYTRRD